MLNGADQTLEDLTDRTVEISVTQVAGDHTCSHPRAVLHLVTDAGEDIDRTLHNLHLAPALDVRLSPVDVAPNKAKVVRRFVASS
jgi:hypothetical protein